MKSCTTSGLKKNHFTELCAFLICHDVELTQKRSVDCALRGRCVCRSLQVAGSPACLRDVPSVVEDHCQFREGRASIYHKLKQLGLDFAFKNLNMIGKHTSDRDEAQRAVGAHRRQTEEQRFGEQKQAEDAVNCCCTAVPRELPSSIFM